MNLKKLYIILLTIIFTTAVQSKELNDSKNEHQYNFYSGTFDVIDKEDDAKTTLVGIQHNNDNLFRDTFLGKFSPLTGAFMTGDNSLYLYTGIQAEYNLGFLNIIPSFAPGYYEAGDGKDLGSALEFKSEIKFDINIFKNTTIGYSYNHISNNDWGSINPGSNNEQLSISTKF
tara:strand:- start:64 stop:582 length:519 start_codon:yes stop_codon:yes gene_type:complete